MIILCSLCGSARRWLNIFLQFFNREKHSQLKEKNISESRSGNMESMVLMSMVPYLIWRLKLGFEKKRETLLWGEEQTQKAGHNAHDPESCQNFTFAIVTTTQCHHLNVTIPSKGYLLFICLPSSELCWFLRQIEESLFSSVFSR